MSHKEGGDRMAQGTKRGLAAASPETRKRVAREGGKARGEQQREESER